jgi:hypothetical protein
MQCKDCLMWFHFGCVKISYDLTALQARTLSWNCHFCRR